MEHSLSAEHCVLSKHASQAVQHLSTVHWLHADDGVLTAFLQLPFAGGFDWPVPMPLHSFGHFAAQQVSMPLPICAPCGYFASHALMQAATGSVPPEVMPLVPDELMPLVPPEVMPLVPDEL